MIRIVKFGSDEIPIKLEHDSMKQDLLDIKEMINNMVFLEAKRDSVIAEMSLKEARQDLILKKKCLKMGSDELRLCLLKACFPTADNSDYCCNNSRSSYGFIPTATGTKVDDTRVEQMSKFSLTMVNDADFVLLRKELKTDQARDYICRKLYEGNEELMETSMELIKLLLISLRDAFSWFDDNDFIIAKNPRFKRYFLFFLNEVLLNCNAKVPRTAKSATGLRLSAIVSHSTFQGHPDVVVLAPHAKDLCNHDVLIKLKVPFGKLSKEVIRGYKVKAQLLIEMEGASNIRGTPKPVITDTKVLLNHNVFPGLITDLFSLNISLRIVEAGEDGATRVVRYILLNRVVDPDEYVLHFLLALSVDATTSLADLANLFDDHVDDGESESVCSSDSPSSWPTASTSSSLKSKGSETGSSEEFYCPPLEKEETCIDGGGIESVDAIDYTYSDDYDSDVSNCCLSDKDESETPNPYFVEHELMERRKQYSMLPRLINK